MAQRRFAVLNRMARYAGSPPRAAWVRLLGVRRPRPAPEDGAEPDDTAFAQPYATAWLTEPCPIILNWRDLGPCPARPGLATMKATAPGHTAMRPATRGPVPQVEASQIVNETAPESGQIGVFLLDDHEIVRKGVRDLLEAEPDIVVVGEAGTAESALARIPALRPDVAVPASP